MKSPLTVPVIFASLYIIIKLVVFNLEKSVDWFVPMILINILLILLAVIFGLRAFRKSQRGGEENFLEDLKCNMRSVSLYAIMISVFVFVYYSAIDKDFTDKIAEKQVQNITKEQYAELQKKDPDMLRDKTIDDYKKLKKGELKLFTSPFMTMTMTLVGLMLIGFFYSLMIALAWPRFLGKLLG